MKTEWIITIIGAIAGAGAGWLYWKYIGCASGHCPITARPMSSAIYGAILGALLFNAAAPSISKTIKNTQQKIEKDDKHA
jgi:hypothetical protein